MMHLTWNFKVKIETVGEDFFCCPTLWWMKHKQNKVVNSVFTASCRGTWAISRPCSCRAPSPSIQQLCAYRKTSWQDQSSSDPDREKRADLIWCSTRKRLLCKPKPSLTWNQTKDEVCVPQCGEIRSTPPFLCKATMSQKTQWVWVSNLFDSIF